MGHPQITEIYEEKIYGKRALVVVHILSFQRDLVVLRLSVLKLIIYSTGKVDKRLRWSRGSVLALMPKFAGSNPAEAVGFLGAKNPQHAFLRRGSKAVGPMS